MPQSKKQTADRPGVYFALTCIVCDAGMEIESRAEAEQLGWTDIVYDDGLSWNYLGYCPECQEPT